MTVGEFKQTDMYANADNVKYFDMFGFELDDNDNFDFNSKFIIGTTHLANGGIHVEVFAS